MTSFETAPHAGDTRTFPGGSATPARLAAGFAAAALSHLTVQSGAIAAFYVAGAPVPSRPGAWPRRRLWACR